MRIERRDVKGKRVIVTGPTDITVMLDPEMQYFVFYGLMLVKDELKSDVGDGWEATGTWKGLAATIKRFEEGIG